MAGFGTGKQPSGDRYAGGPPSPNGGNTAGQAPAPSMIDQNAMAGAAGFNAQNEILTQTMGQIRQIGEAVKGLAQLIPQAADEIQQIQQLLKQAVIKAAQGTPMQTGSGMAVPGGQGMGAGAPAGASGAPGGQPPPQQ